MRSGWRSSVSTGGPCGRPSHLAPFAPSAAADCSRRRAGFPGVLLLSLSANSLFEFSRLFQSHLLSRHPFGASAPLSAEGGRLGVALPLPNGRGSVLRFASPNERALSLGCNVVSGLHLRVVIPSMPLRSFATLVLPLRSKITRIGLLESVDHAAQYSSTLPIARRPFFRTGKIGEMKIFFIRPPHWCVRRVRSGGGIPFRLAPSRSSRFATQARTMPSGIAAGIAGSTSGRPGSCAGQEDLRDVSPRCIPFSGMRCRC
jgi:hypothetical protein